MHSAWLWVAKRFRFILLLVAVSLLPFAPAPEQAAGVPVPDGTTPSAGQSDLRIAQPPKDVDEKTEAAGAPS